ncbi:MAG: gamma-glutamyl-gamma-aminobutyrate hydrolase family protein [Acidobacteria bacterium]|nr:gamma-glutamyl-gamma-aminobutyrate hydrolase family protein [Acidobacteriota bacterium]
MTSVTTQIMHHHTPVTVHSNYCLYEPIVPEIKAIRVLTIDSLVGSEDQYSEVARSAPDFDAARWVKLERKIAGMALANIESNIERLVVHPTIKRVHFSELSHELTREFQAEAIILSGTLRDFDFYRPELFEKFNEFIRSTSVPVLAICGGHQMVGQAFGANIVTLDEKPPSERRTDRLVEYQYRFVRIENEDDPIFERLLGHPGYERQHKNTKVIRVWQNHGLQLDRLPAGFTHLARGYLADQQMMVRRTETQLIYGVQFHIEKSFQDWNLDNYWNHRVESRDGRLIFENFLIEALRFIGKTEEEIFAFEAERAAKMKELSAQKEKEPTAIIRESGW